MTDEQLQYETRTAETLHRLTLYRWQSIWAYCAAAASLGVKLELIWPPYDNN